MSHSLYTDGSSTDEEIAGAHRRITLRNRNERNERERLAKQYAILTKPLTTEEEEWKAGLDKQTAEGKKMLAAKAKAEAKAKLKRNLFMSNSPKLSDVSSSFSIVEDNSPKFSDVSSFVDIEKNNLPEFSDVSSSVSIVEDDLPEFSDVSSSFSIVEDDFHPRKKSRKTPKTTLSISRNSAFEPPKRKKGGRKYSKKNKKSQYVIRKLPGSRKYKVYNRKTKRVHSKATTLKRAKAQVRLLNMQMRKG